MTEGQFLKQVLPVPAKLEQQELQEPNQVPNEVPPPKPEPEPKRKRMIRIQPEATSRDIEEMTAMMSNLSMEDAPIGEPVPLPDPEILAYNETIADILEIAKQINVSRGECDGRIDSAMKEVPFLEELKTRLLEKHPEWTIDIPTARSSYDIMINEIRMNLKITACQSADNSASKPSLFYSMTGIATYPKTSTWNCFLDRLVAAQMSGNIKLKRHKPTEYHYLVKNKETGDVLLKPVFDIHTYISNPSNDLQINWKNEFLHRDYETKEEDYIGKVKSLLQSLQKSAQDMIAKTTRFANADVSPLFEEVE